MALSKPKVEELLEHILEHIKQMAGVIEETQKTNKLLHKELKEANKTNAFLCEKAKNAEMRQCTLQGDATTTKTTTTTTKTTKTTTTPGEGTDATRMFLSFLQGGSASCSKHTQRVIAEKICKTKSVESVTYLGLFSAKDTRRGEFAAVAFYFGYVHEDIQSFDVFEGEESSLDKLFQYLPSMREMVLDWAAEFDREGAPEIDGQTQVQRAAAALGEIPEGLEALLKVILPVDKRHEPIQQKTDEEDNQLFLEQSRKLPERAIEYMALVKDQLQLECGNQRTTITKAIVKWCRVLQAIENAKYEISQDEYQAKRTKTNYEEEAENHKDDMVVLKRHAETHCKAFAKILSDHKQFVARKKAECQAKGQAAEGSSA